MLDEILNSKDFDKVRKEVKIRFLGDLTPFSSELREKIKKVEKLTSKNAKYTLAIFCNYGGRKEIVDAVNKIIKDAKEGKIDKIDEGLFSKYLYTAELPDPDLIFRSGEEKRLSGFLPWQSVYSEFYFSDKLWPDITKKDILAAINDFKKRERRFGR
ncbi:MAG: polyprenyl diphosphate synthase, partial [Candidatus Micrarchaeota archaeon]|nr:polyprenyl diphosphate synthase [Candidatus Micrarchaeota archaeon]